MAALGAQSFFRLLSTILLMAAWSLHCGGPTGKDDNPELAAVPDTLDFGETQTSLQLTIDNVGSGVLDWSIHLPSEGWISANPPQGKIVNTPVTIDVRIDREQAPGGQQQRTLVIAGSTGTQEIILRALIFKPQLSVSQDTVNFGANDRSKTLVVQNTGTGVLDWTITIPSETWLQVTPLKGKTSEQASTVTVTVDLSHIDDNGIYSADMVIASNGGNLIVPVIMSVEGNTPVPLLQVSPLALGFGTSSSRQTIGISNSGESELIWEATSGQNWLKITPSSGAATTTPDQIIIEVDRALLPPGEHTGSIDITSNGGSKALPVTVSVPTPVLSLNTREIDFRADLATFTLMITNSGTGDLDWLFEENLSWLTIEPIQGTTGQITTPVVMTVERARLETGSLDKQVRLSSNSVTEPSIDLRVKMRVPARPVLGVSLDSLDFGDVIEEISIEIENRNNDVLEWQIEVEEPWISFAPVSGSTEMLTSTSAKIRIDRKGRVAGSYSGHVKILSNDREIFLPIRMEVPQAPRLVTSTQAVNLGDGQLSSTIEIQNGGTGRLTWTVAAEDSWVTTDPKSGTTLDETDSITLSVARTDLLAGDYQSTIGIESDGGEGSILVEMSVSPNPVLSLSDEEVLLEGDREEGTLAITNLGNSTLTWSVSQGMEWIQIVPHEGATEPGQSTEVSIQVGKERLEPGTYEPALSLTSNGGNATIVLRIEVNRAVLAISSEAIRFVSNTVSADLIFSNIGNIPLDWSALVGSDWLGVTPENGAIEGEGSQNVAVHINRTGLLPGKYAGAIAVESSGGRKNIDIEMEVLAVPLLSLSETRLDFGSETDTKHVTISNRGNSELTWRLGGGSGVITVAQEDGRLEPDQSTDLTIQIARDSLGVGIHELELPLISNGGDQSLVLSVGVYRAILSALEDSLILSSDETQRVVTLSNEGNIPLTWNIDEEIDWLKILPDSGSLEADSSEDVTFDVNRANLTPGTYTGAVRVSSDSGQHEIAIEIEVAARPLLSVSEVDLDYGATLDTRNLMLGNQGNAPLQWHLDYKKPGIEASKAAGGLEPGQTVELEIRVLRDSLKVGIHEIQIPMTSNGGDQELTLHIEVNRAVAVVSEEVLDFPSQLAQAAFVLSNDGNIPLIWDITEEIGWLKVAPENGEIEAGASQEVVLDVSRSELSPGSYSGSLSISSNGGAYLLSIEAEVAAIPLLVLSDRRLDFGEDVDQHQISVSNEGNAPLEWEIRENLTGVEISPSGGQLNPGELSEVSIQLVRPDIEPGRQEILLPLYSDGGNATVVCQVTVNRAVLSVSKDTANFRSDFRRSVQVIKNDGNIDLTWDISEDLPWLEILPATGITGANATQSIELKADRSDLPIGNHSGVVTIESNGGVHHIQVLLEVEPSFRWSISDTEINLEPYDQAHVVSVSNDGNIAFSWSIVGIEDWLEVLPNEGSLEIGQEVDLTIRVRQRPPPIGKFDATLVFESSMGDSTFPIGMTVPGAILTTAVDSVHFHANTAEVVLSITNRGNTPLEWRAENRSSWLLISPANGSLQGGGSTNIHLTADRSGLPSGFSSDILSFISDSGEGSVLIPVSIEMSGNARPVADAGPDQVVKVGETVRLDGSGSFDPDGDRLAFEWTSSSSGVAFSGRTLERATFIPTQSGTYRISLVVNDGNLKSVLDEVVIEARGTDPIISGDRIAIVDGRYVETISISQTSINNVGPNQSVEVAVSVTGVSGVKQFDVTLEVAPAGVFDLLRTTFAHNAATFTISPGIEFPAANQLKTGAASFGAAAYGDHWLGTFKLTTTSDFSTSSTAVIRVVRVSIGESSIYREVFSEEDLGLVIQINGEAPSSTANHPPVSNAGPDQTVEVGETVTLDGRGCSDPDGDVLSYRWIVPAGITLSSKTNIQPRFAATTAGVYTLALVSNDGEIDSAPDEVRITIVEPNQAPIANAGPDQTVEAGETVVLDGSGSSDADGDFLTYRWSAPSGVTLSSLTVSRPTFVASVAGTYRISLVVTDGARSSTPDTVVVTVEAPTTGDAQVIGEVIEGNTGDAEVIGEVIEGNTGDAEVIGEVIEGNTGDAEVIGEVIEEEKGDAEVIGEVKE